MHILYFVFFNFGVRRPAAFQLKLQFFFCFCEFEGIKTNFGRVNRSDKVATVKLQWIDICELMPYRSEPLN